MNYEIAQKDNVFYCVKDPNIWAKVICDSIRPDGPSVRITTVVHHCPRMIHAEFMTHRDRARNAASSRAVSVKMSFAKPTFFPLDIPSEQRGMSGGDTLIDDAKLEVYRDMFDLYNTTLATCRKWADMGVHKSVINRYLEPFRYIEVVQTATRWDHFLNLRIAPDAEPHFIVLARCIKMALESSIPVARVYHLPFVSEDGDEPTLMRVSAARCAGISYQRPNYTMEKELKVCEELVTKRHSSPLEHPAHCKVSLSYRSGPMCGWKTLRDELQQN